MNLRCTICGASNHVPAGDLAIARKCARCRQPMPAPCCPVAVTAAEVQEATRDAPWRVLVDVWAPSSAAAKGVGLELEKVARRHQGHLLVLKMNAEAEQEAAAQLGVCQLPTLVLFEGGREVHRLEGALSAEEIESAFFAA